MFENERRVVLAFALLTGALWGESVHLSPRLFYDVTEYRWGDTNTWVDAEGARVQVAPTNGEDVCLNVYSNAFYSIMLATGATTGSDAKARVINGAVDPTVGTLSGGQPRIRIYHTDTTSSAACQPIRRFTIGQAAGFPGFWYARNAKAYFSFGAENRDDIGMSSLSAANRPHVEVTSAGTKVTLEETFGAGMIQKDGAGTLEISAVHADAASNLNYAVRGGTLTLPGEKEGELDDLLASSAIRLDASATETLVISNGEGRAWVTHWGDVYGRDLAAEYAWYSNLTRSSGGQQYFLGFTRPAYVADEISPTGLRLVSFGSRGGGADTTALYGPTNLTLLIKKAGVRTDIVTKEAFYVVRTPQGADDCTVLGHTDGGGGGDYVFYSEYRILGDTGYGRPLRNGEMRLDGEAFTLDAYNSPAKCAALKERTYVMNLVPTNDNAKVNLLGSDRYYHARSGGSRLGEVILFTNALTRAQRTRINNYLVEKWVRGISPKVMAGNALIVDNAADVAVGVAAGRTARLNDIKLEGTTFVKTGPGTLQADTLHPVDKTLSVTVQDGAFGFTGGAAPATDAPAADPWLWLDAEVTDTVKTFASDFWPDTTLVNEWRDCRPAVENFGFSPTTNGVYISETSMRTPSYTTFEGKRVLDFGTEWPGKRAPLGKSYTNCACLRFSGTLADGTALCRNSRCAQAGFIVIRFLIGNMAWQIFGGSQMDFYRSTSYTLLSTSYEAWLLSGVTWTLDGEIVDPLSTTYAAKLQDTAGFHVLGFTSDRPVNFTHILLDRDETVPTYVYSSGGAQVGEVLSYDRPLSPAERRQTEAYLLKKWLDKDHPAAAEKRVSQITFAEGKPAAFASETAMTVGGVAYTGSSVKKSGTGKVTVGQLVVTNDLDAVTVTGGELDMKIHRSDWARDALFHFDASDFAAMETRVTDDGAGGAVTNILSMQDVRRNGIYATSSFHLNGDKKYYQSYGDPTLSCVKMPDGALRPAIDFGDSQNAAAKSTNFTASSFSLSQQFTDVREVHAIWQDRQDKGTVRMAVATDLNRYNFLRQGANIIQNFSKENHPNGPWRFYEDTAYVATNGVKCPYSTTLNNKQFYLVSLVPGEGGSYVSTIALERTSSSGGARVCEYVAFGRVLSDEERAAVQRRLMAKWFEGSDLPVTNGLGQVTVAAGATLNLAADANAVFTLSGLSGAGALKTAGTLALDGALNVAFTAPGACGTITVDGTLALAAGTALRVSCAFSPARALAVGEYPVLTATTLEGATPTLETEGFPTSFRFRLLRRGSALYLRVQKAGTTIFVR